MQWPSKCVRPSNLIMAVSCYSDFSNSLLGADTGTGYWLKLLGWLGQAVGERGWSACFPESRCNPPPPFSSHATHKHTNTTHRRTRRDKCMLTHKFTDSSKILCTIIGAQMSALNRKKNTIHRILKWRHRTPLTALLFSYLHMQLCVWSLGPSACVWGVMRRGPSRRDKRKSDGGQAAASLAALTDQTHTTLLPLWQAVQDTVCLHKVINNLAWVDMD